MEKLILETYSIMVSFFSVIFLPIIFIARLMTGKDVSSWKIKSGNYKIPDDFDTAKKTIMIHGVSVGEIISLEKLIKKIKENFPDHNIIITTGTKTGQETAIKKLNDTADLITYFPFDIPFCVKRFLKSLKPDVILTAETEIWPVFAYFCKKNGIKNFIINGRISDNSYKSYKILKPFFKFVLPLFDEVFTQSKIDCERYKFLGAKNVEVMKNLKFDIKKFETNLNLETKGARLLIAGSTHKGEDEIVLNVFKNLKQYGLNVKLLLAPRHLTRTGDVESLIKKDGFSYNLYSKKPFFENADIVLLDVMGELAKLYSACDVAFIGGSFNKTGGHNPLEASIFEKPVISGPSVKNFRDIYAILTNSKSAFIVKDEKEFYNTALKLFCNDDFYGETTKNVKNIFEYQKGALEFVINKLKEVV